MTSVMEQALAALDQATLGGVAEPDGRITDPATAWEVAQVEDRYRTLGEVADRSADQRLAQAEQRARQAEGRADRADRDLAEFRERIARRMIEEARDRDWCSEFDQIMVEVGLGEFVRRDVEVEITFTVTVTVNGDDEPEESELDRAAIQHIRHETYDWRVVD